MKKTCNIVLSSGLLVVSAKTREGTPVITLFITDYSDNTRVMFDVEQKCILVNRDDIVLSAQDIEALVAAFGIKDAKKEIKKVADEFAGKVAEVSKPDVLMPF